MRAVIVDRFMLPSELRVSEAPDPEPLETEVLVSVRAAGVNFFDTLIVQGKYQEKPPFPFSPGGEIAGVVEKVGARVTGITPGDRVMAFFGHGGFAERAVAGADAVVPIPEGMSFEEAAGFPIVYGTAYMAVVQRGQARAGETVAVTAASGGVGLASVQIAKAVGARVIALASADKLDVAKSAGADVAIDYRADGWIEAFGRATDGRGADVIVENVGGDVFDGCTKHVAWGGRVVVVGFASGKIPDMRMNRVLLKHISVVGVHWSAARHRDIQAVHDGFRALASLYREKKIAPLIWKTLPLDRVAEALSMLEGRQSVGKIVLTV
jgi:NADPH2:quinone reductase